jgi:hypothetical protein
VDARGKLQVGVGVAILVVGIFVFDGVIEIIVAMGGVFIAAQARQRSV